MKKRLSQKDIEDGKKINEIFQNLGEKEKDMAIVYLSALMDRQMVANDSAS